MDKTQEKQKNEPLWVMKERCKACAKCVFACPAGVLGMTPDVNTIYGRMISIDRAEYCIGCYKCENACPDFAIFVTEKDKFSFPKITKEARERQAKILENEGRSLPEQGEEDENA
ncbi:MAG: 4Fe-4S binding protein [Candidatus Parcubacteria bacterium]|nr:4Fe-4S binding protein [Candidatus Parcubacteria bacterium]